MAIRQNELVEVNKSFLRLKKKNTHFNKIQLLRFSIKGSPTNDARFEVSHLQKKSYNFAFFCKMIHHVMIYFFRKR